MDCKWQLCCLSGCCSFVLLPWFIREVKQAAARSKPIWSWNWQISRNPLQVATSTSNNVSFKIACTHKFVKILRRLTLSALHWNMLKSNKTLLIEKILLNWNWKASDLKWTMIEEYQYLNYQFWKELLCTVKYGLTTLFKPSLSFLWLMVYFLAFCIFATVWCV